MADVSPTKWHRGHTTWFFETFLLEPTLPGYDAFDPDFRYLFNSYYEAVGPRHPRATRARVAADGRRGRAVPRARRRRDGEADRSLRRRRVARAVGARRARPAPRAAAPRAAAHGHQARALEQPVRLRVRRRAAWPRSSPARPLRMLEHEGGLVEVGHGDRRVRVRQRVAAPQGVPRAVPHRRPARDRGRVARVHGRRRLPRARALALRRLVRGAEQRAGTRRCTGATTAPTVGRCSRSAGGGRSIRTSPSCT